ncbi:MAG: CBS domain-containing protein [Halorientalis sp.]
MELPTAEDLRERRDDLDLTQAELAERADVSQPLIARIEGGDVDPRLSTLRRIVNALDEAEGGILRAEDLMHSPVYGVEPDDSVAYAVETMNQEGYSQLPVVRDNYPVGIVSLGDIRHAEGEEPGDLPVADVMRESITTVTREATVDEIETHLDHHEAVIVIDDGEMVGIITDADVAANLS